MFCSNSTSCFEPALLMEAGCQEYDLSQKITVQKLIWREFLLSPNYSNADLVLIMPCASSHLKFFCELQQLG